MCGTVARWQKIVQNNFKGAVKNIFWPRSFGGHTAPNFGQKWQKRTGKYILTVFTFFTGQQKLMFGSVKMVFV